MSFLEKDTDKFLNQLFEKRNGLLKSGGAALDDTQSNKRRAGETAAPQSDQKRVKTGAHFCLPVSIADDWRYFYRHARDARDARRCYASQPQSAAGA